MRFPWKKFFTALWSRGNLYCTRHCIMEARNVKPVVAAVAAMFLCAAPAAYAAMFKWTDAAGTVTYSDQPPPDRAQVRHVAQLDSGAGGSESNAGALVRVADDPSLSRPDTWLKGATPPPPAERIPKVEPAPPATKVEADPFSREVDLANREADSARAPLRGAREAARDPCLRSSDPKCYERNKGRYHPYLGYAPEAGPAVGTTTAAVAGGTVGGHVTTAPASASPRKVETPLIFLDQPHPEKKRSSRWPFGSAR